MPIRLVSPMNETSREKATPARRLSSLEARTIALLDISKPGGSIFLDRIERLLKERYLVGSVIREMKPTFAKPAPPGVIEKIRSADAIIEGLAD